MKGAEDRNSCHGDLDLLRCCCYLVSSLKRPDEGLNPSRAQSVGHHSPGFHAAEIRRRGSKDLLKVCVLTEVGEETAEAGPPGPSQTYDLPYEGSGETDKAAGTQPDPPPRPPAEYERPWECTKERLVRALSGNISGYLVFLMGKVPKSTKNDETSDNISHNKFDL